MVFVRSLLALALILGLTAGTDAAKQQNNKNRKKGQAHSITGVIVDIDYAGKGKGGTIELRVHHGGKKAGKGKGKGAQVARVKSALATKGKGKGKGKGQGQVRTFKVGPGTHIERDGKGNAPDKKARFRDLREGQVVKVDLGSNGHVRMIEIMSQGGKGKAKAQGKNKFRVNK